MPGIKIRIDADEARVATEKLAKDLKDLGLQTKMTEKEIKELERRLISKMGADKGKEAVDRLAKSLGLTRLESLALHQQLTKNPFSTMEKGIDMIRGGWMKATLAMAGFAAGLYAVMNMWETAGKALQAEEAFNAITKSLNLNGEALLANMKRASAGTMDDSDIMQASLRALAQDIEGLEEKLPDLMEGARTAAKITGDTVAESFEKLVTGIATDMPRGLKAMGAVTKEQMTLINQAYAVGITNIKLGDIAISNLKTKTALFNAETTSAYENLQKFRAELHELKEWASKGGLLILEKLGAVFMQIGVRIEAAAAKAKMLNAQALKREAWEESDPVERAKKLKEAAKMESEARDMAVEAYNREQLSREELTGKPAKLVTPGQRQIMDILAEKPETSIMSKQLDKTPERSEYVKRKAKEEEAANNQKIKDQINEIAQKQQYAENLKNIDAAELREMDATGQKRIAIMKLWGAEEFRVEDESIALKEKLNETWYSNRIKEIAAEGEAKLAATKNWTTEERDKWVGAEKNVAKYEMQARKAETTAARGINKAREEVHNLTVEWEISRAVFVGMATLYDQKTQSMITHLDALQSRTKAQIAFEQELANVRERYGQITPKQQVEQDFDARRKYLEMEKASLELRMQRLIDKPGAGDAEEAEGLKISYEVYNIEKQLMNLETLRALKLKEYTDDWKAGMETGLKRFRVEIGSEFQIWETFAYDSARAMSGAFEEFFFDALSGKMKSFEDYWRAFADGLRRALAQALSKELMGTIFDNAGGGGGGLMSLLGPAISTFGGWMGMGPDMSGAMIPSMSNEAGLKDFFSSDAYAEGGRPTVGKVALVGERGPELFIPDQAGSWTLRGGMPAGIPARAAGGNVASLSPYIVGEHGPELFIPKRPGEIIPNHRIDFRADGGGVDAGSPYIVGERGAELFVPKAGGTIVPNESLGGGISEMSITVPITITGGNPSKAMLSELREEMARTAEDVVRRHS